MTILAVDNNPDRLWALVDKLRMAFPKDIIEYTHDPLMAGRFGFFRPVDILFAEMVMKRMDGSQLAVFLREKNPDMTAYLIADEGECAEKSPLKGGIAEGRIARTITVDTLREMVQRDAPVPARKAEPAPQEQMA